MTKLLVEKASNWEDRQYKEFKDVDELLNFVDEVGHSVIITKCLDGSKKLLIYDDYIE